MLSVGKKPPPETNVMVILRELKSLSPEILSNVRIKILNKIPATKVLI